MADRLSVAELHRVIQLLVGWDDDHLHRFRIHGREYGIAHIGGPSFAEDAAAVPLSRFGFRPTERFLYEYDFTAGWQMELRVERVIEAAPCEGHRVPVCVAGRQAVRRTAVVGRRLMPSDVAMQSVGGWPMM